MGVTVEHINNHIIASSNDVGQGGSRISNLLYYVQYLFQNRYQGLSYCLKYLNICVLLNLSLHLVYETLRSVKTSAWCDSTMRLIEDVKSLLENKIADKKSEKTVSKSFTTIL